MDNERGAEGAAAGVEACVSAVEGAGGSRQATRTPPRAKSRGVNWAQARRLYELTDTPTVEILQRFALTPSQLRWRRHCEDWTPRLPAAGARQARFAPERLRARLRAVHGTLAGRLEAAVAMSEAFEAEQARGLLLLAECFPALDAREEAMARRKSMEARRAAPNENKKKNIDDGSDAGDAGDARDARDARDDPAFERAELERRILEMRAAAGLEADAGGGER